MKYRSECNCPCHSGRPFMHYAPCCKPDVEFTTRYVEDLTVSPQPRYAGGTRVGDPTVMCCSVSGQRNISRQITIIEYAAMDHDHIKITDARDIATHALIERLENPSRSALRVDLLATMKEAAEALRHRPLVHAPTRPTFSFAIEGNLLPIDTAPRDGTWVLIGGGKTSEGEGYRHAGLSEEAIKRPVVGRFSENQEQWLEEGESPSELWDMCYWDSAWRSCYINPTWWMPLPKES